MKYQVCWKTSTETKTHFSLMWFCNGYQSPVKRGSSHLTHKRSSFLQPWTWIWSRANSWIRRSSLSMRSARAMRGCSSIRSWSKACSICRQQQWEKRGYYGKIKLTALCHVINSRSPSVTIFVGQSWHSIYNLGHWTSSLVVVSGSNPEVSSIFFAREYALPEKNTRPSAFHRHCPSSSLIHVAHWWFSISGYGKKSQPFQQQKNVVASKRGFIPSGAGFEPAITMSRIFVSADWRQFWTISSRRDSGNSTVSSAGELMRAEISCMVSTMELIGQITLPGFFRSRLRKRWFKSLFRSHWAAR